MTRAMSPATDGEGLERAGLLALAAALGIVQLTIFAWVPLVVAGVVWMVLVSRDRGMPAVPAFFWPLLALAAWTLVSSVFSMDPAASFYRDRQMLLFLVVPVTMRLAAGPRATTVLDTIIAVGAASALIGIIQYLALGYDTLQQRPHGLLGHYMTYSGVLMLVICASAARLVFAERKWIWPAVAVPALLLALVGSQSRNAWVGAVLAIACLLALRSWKLLVAMPVALAIILVAAPPSIRQRALSSFDPYDPSNRDRVAMLQSGRLMIQDHPIVGVGPNMVPRAYVDRYKTAGAVDPAGSTGPQTRAHLHNVPVQLAAERGLPALLAWLGFVAIAIRDLYRLVRRGPSRPLAAAGLAAVVAMLAAGLFEHNFGDSEFLLLFLGLITLPFAAAHGPVRAEADTARAA